MAAPAPMLQAVDNRRGFCLRAAEWNGCCTRHVNHAADEGELI